MKSLFDGVNERAKFAASRSLRSLLIDAVVRAAFFIVALQIISYFGIGRVGSLANMLFLGTLFGAILFAINVIEKYWAVERLKKRG